MNYTFRLTKFNQPLHTFQVSQALLKYAEASTRKFLPSLWCLSDYFAKHPKHTPAEQTELRKKYRLLSFALIALGCLATAIATHLLSGEPIIFMLGLLVLVIGAVLYCCTRDRRDLSFENGAKLLLDSLALCFAEGRTVNFTAVSIEQITPGGKNLTIHYDKCTLLVKTVDLYIIFYQDTLLILQQSDLPEDQRKSFLTDLQDMTDMNFIFI